MQKYLPKEIEKKWKDRWTETNLYKFTPSDVKGENYYNLVELPYTSGDLHLGHWFAFTPPDIHARHKRMLGYNVFYPVGFDAFGLPAENAAIKRNLHPEDWTLENVENMQKQFMTMGTMIDWDHKLVTCSPEYYRWNQWIFLKMFKRGLAYLDKALLNWCPFDQTVLADENIEAGKCWRCGNEVTKKLVEEWFLKLTDYAEELIWPETPTVDWPKSVRVGQNNWIGKKPGITVKFEEIEVFTTRPDTLFGVTFVVVSPEYPLLSQFIKPENEKRINQYLEDTKKKSELERKENKDKSGVFTGSFVKNPLSGENIAVWVADYVLADFGTGAVMGVPAHDQRDFEFAKKNNLEIKFVVKPVEGDLNQNQPFENEGELINSGEYTGLTSDQARENISIYIEEHHLGSSKTTYHLRDWSISRQRYWGTPVPIIHCKSCGLVPVPYEDLPVKLPRDVDFTPKGKPPLASNEEWLKVKCPKCGQDAVRDAQTLDGFFDNSWYFMRYLDPKYDQLPFDKDLAAKMTPLNIYFGGAEHTLGHTLYARFFTKFFRDIGLVDFDEFALKRVQHGVVLGPDGNRMSKSRGNVVNPDDVISEFGVDTVRVYLSFMMPYIDATAPWSTSAIAGVYRFLNRIWDLYDKVSDSVPNDQDLTILNQTVQKVGKDIEEIHFNTAVAALMEWLNYLSRKDKVSKQEYKTFLLLLAPFAPHFSEELWEMMGQSYSIHQQKWPKIDESKIDSASINLAVQINGKVRDVISISAEKASNQTEVEGLAKGSVKIQKYIKDQEIKKTIFVSKKIINFLI